MTVLRELQARAAANPALIAMSEGHDPRVVAGAVQAVRDGMAKIILVGAHAEVTERLAENGAGDLDGITIADPATSALTPEFADLYFELRKHKGVSKDAAAQMAADPLMFAALMVRAGYADGTIGGAVATTSDTVRAALQIIGKASDAALVSSFFLMQLPDGHASGRNAIIFSDCGLVIDPNATELAAIAAASARSCEALLGEEPKIAMLSFSTKGSARHPNVTKVTDATESLRQSHPELRVDGELQFDAAFVPSVAAAKAPGSEIAGAANIFVFPNLDAGNIGYKIAQRIGGALAIGPILQGLAKPANDLSRGCSAEDVLNMIAVTTAQAQTRVEPKK